MQPSKKSTEGSVTAEFAVILPVVVLVIAMLVNVMVIGMHQSKLHQAAAVAARQLARGEAPGAINTSVTTMTSTTTSVTTSSSGRWATVELTSPVPGPLGLIPSIELTAQAKAPNQWTVEP
ncbi:MAG: pilus assembly protein [Yaniella sp.]|nr:pilus assembly protein [Yaniella sp.]